ncbi:Cytochrome P450 [Penicillium verhagenii]|nr:Cytochrome P450 [Penicillium verhagenii]
MPGGSQHAGIFELSMPKSGPIEVEICSAKQVSVVAVHGLQGDAYRTWTHDKSQICWLRDILPDHIKNARVLTWGYIANMHSLNGKMTSSDRILHHAETLIEELQIDRESGNAQQRPIIFVCHSLGGIIVKRALTLSEGCTSPKNARLHSIYTCTFGIIFFGTPHNGSGKARQVKSVIKFASFVVPRKIARFETNLVTGLEDDSETLQNITQDFSKMMARYSIFFFWEQLQTDLKYSMDYIVDRDSAALVLDGTGRCGIAANHGNMCKFEDVNSPGLKVVLATLKRYSLAAPVLIDKRLLESKRMLDEKRRNEALELVGEYQLPLSSGKRKELDLL